jgi:hypothetical protein
MDVSDSPDLLKIAEEVGVTGEGRLLRRGRKELAVVMPIRRRASKAGRPSKADIDAFRQAAGTWQDVGTDKLVKEIRASRRSSSRPAVDL